MTFSFQCMATIYRERKRENCTLISQGSMNKQGKSTKPFSKAMRTSPTVVWFHHKTTIYRRCIRVLPTWWRHQMETFSASLALCAGNSPVTGEFPKQRPLTRSFDVFFDLRLNKPLGKQSWGRWFETPLRSLWRYCNEGKHNNLEPERSVL